MAGTIFVDSPILNCLTSQIAVFQKVEKNKINLDKADVFNPRIYSNFILNGIIWRSFKTCIRTFLLFFCRVLLKIENYLLLTSSHSIRLLAIDRIPCNANVSIKKVCTARFWNNFHQVCSKSKAIWNNKTKGPKQESQNPLKSEGGEP